MKKSDLYNPPAVAEKTNYPARSFSASGESMRAGQFRFSPFAESSNATFGKVSATAESSNTIHGKLSAGGESFPVGCGLFFTKKR